VRSLRGRRGLVTGAVLSASAAILLIGLSGSRRDTFINPRALSPQHSGAEFARLASAAGGGQGCVLCHAEANADLGDLVVSALAASRVSLRFAVLAGNHPKDFSRMDHSCIACHAAQSFHQADVARDLSCSVCHMEHRGARSMAEVTAQGCVDCHGSATDMRMAAERSRVMPAMLFMRKAATDLVIHTVPRPADGYTGVITSFAVDHPEFRVLRVKSPDLNTLRFNHRLHLTGADIPLVNGHPLECADCHRPDASGAYMARISFEQSCRACHALEFDEQNPGMTLPHGDASFARAYLRSLPAQYADYATRKLGITGHSEIAAFVRNQVESLRRREHTGEELERKVFLGGGWDGPQALGGGKFHARFEGCALCHDVSWRENGAPAVTRPVTPDRWLTGASFNHASHATMACAECHAAAASDRTSDVILPNQQSCVRCHSPKGGAADSCTSCHIYHNQPPPALARNAETASAP
jgi:hypothetical protein